MTTALDASLGTRYADLLARFGEQHRRDGTGKPGPRPDCIVSYEAETDTMGTASWLTLFEREAVVLAQATDPVDIDDRLLIIEILCEEWRADIDSR